MIVPPRQRDLDVVISEVGQDIILRKIVRTTVDGKTTSISHVDKATKAIVNEFADQTMDVDEPGRYEEGNVKFTIHPDIDIDYFDMILWHGMKYNIQTKKSPIEIGNSYVYRIVIGVKEIA